MNRRGVTLPEVLVAFALFSILGVILVYAFNRAGHVYRAVSGSTDSQTILARAQASLSRDVKRTEFDSVGVRPASSSLGAVDGDVVWFLSAVDPSTRELYRKRDGTPFWCCNILYYAAVPDNHFALVGYNCTGGADADGYEVQCPHKVLIRKVIDDGAAFDSNDESTEERPLSSAQALGLASRPNGHDLSAMGAEPGLLQATIVAANLLTFRGQLAPAPEWPTEVRIELEAVSISTAQRELNLGSVPLANHRLTTHLTLPLFPGLP